MKKTGIFLYAFYLIICTFCGLSFPLLRENINYLYLFIPAFIVLNLFVGVFSAKMPSLRLRVCRHGALLLAVFLPSTCIAVIHHVVLAFKMIPGDWKNWLWHALFAFGFYFVIFWNGIICVYLTSAQLGIRQRAIGLICGLIPVANVFCLVSIIKTTLREVKFEAEKEEINRARSGERVCATKYPILLVHGVCFRDSKIFNYWGRIPRELERNGARIFYGNHHSASSVAFCSEELAERIREIVRETGAEKVNIIAHSKGGLDCRYAIAKCGVADLVASLTTINSPHKGCQYADTLLTVIPNQVQDKVATTYNKALRHLGDISPDFLTAMSNLTASYCAELALELDDAVEKHGIYRQSVGSIMGSAKSAGFPLNYFYLIVKDFDGPNDGLVSDKSFEFGEKFTLLTPKTRRGISHMDVIDMVKMDVPEFDVREFYVDLVRDLRERGL